LFTVVVIVADQRFRFVPMPAVGFIEQGKLQLRSESSRWCYNNGKRLCHRHCQ